MLQKLKSNPRLKKIALWTITPNRNPKPRLWIRLLVNPFIHKKGKGAKIRRRSRIDVFPWNRFEIGALTTIEDFCTINNGSGDIILGDRKSRHWFSYNWPGNNGQRFRIGATCFYCRI